MDLTKQLTRQVTRTVAGKAVREGAKKTNIHPLVKRMGVAAIIAGISYMVSKKL